MELVALCSYDTLSSSGIIKLTVSSEINSDIFALLRRISLFP